MQCAYCHEDKNATREHIIPKSFLSRMNMPEMVTWLDRAPNKFIKSEMVVKDVCAGCNNGVLSYLDDYAVNLVVSYNSKLNINTQKLLFQYDFNQLSRWLLKVCFNSARANNCRDDSELYSFLIDYIMYNKTPNIRFSIYASLMELDIKNETYYHLTNKAYELDHFRICPFRFNEMSGYKCTFRIIMINSFAFIIMIFDDCLKSDEVKLLNRACQKTYPDFVRLIEKNSITLKKDKTLWEKSLITHTLLNSDFFGNITSIDRNCKDFKMVEIQRADVENLDLSNITSVLEALKETRQVALSNMQNVEMCVRGYDDDCRELYQIPEFQKFVQVLIEKHPELIFFLNLDWNFIKVLVSTYINDDFITDVTNSNRIININPEKLHDFIIKSFLGLNGLTNLLVLDDSINRDISLKFKQLLKSLSLINDEQ